MKAKAVVLTYTLTGNDPNGAIPVGTTERLKIEVQDEIAKYHFDKASTTKRFILIMQKEIIRNKSNYLAEYSERSQTGVVLYPTLEQKELTEHIVKWIEEMKKKKNE